MSTPEAAGPPPNRPDDAAGQVPEAPTQSPTVGCLRIAACVGTGAVVVWRVVSLAEIKSRQEWAFLVLILVAIAIWLTFRTLLRTPAQTLRRHRDLLLPLGLYIPAEALLSLLASAPVLAGVLAPTWSLKIFSINIALSAGFVIQLLLGVVYAGWTTTLVLQAVRDDRVDPVTGLNGIGRWFLRVFALEFISWAVLLAGIAVAIPVGTASIALALILIGGLSLLWNLTTAAVLPVAIAEHGSFGAVLREGMRVSWSRKRGWWRPVVVQMLILGWVTYVYVSFASSPRPGSFVRKTSDSWHVNAFWTGGYEDTCRWHADVMRTLEVETLPLVTTLLTLLCAVLAVAVKLYIAARIYGPSTEPAARDDLDRRAQGG